jgi:hypothetical protein
MSSQRLSRRQLFRSADAGGADDGDWQMNDALWINREVL